MAAIEVITPLTLSEREKIQKIVKWVQEKQYIFVLGPNGVGKTSLIQNAIKVINNKLGHKTITFDLENYQNEDARDFYGEILEKISGEKHSFTYEEDLSNQFIEELNQCVTETHLLVFDGFRAINRDFYEHFSSDCRKINMEGASGQSPGLNRIVMLFGGSMPVSEPHDQSTLWMIVEPIEVGPLPKKEAKENIRVLVEHFKLRKPRKDQIDFIYNATRGYRFITEAFIRFSGERIIATLNLSDPEIQQKTIARFIDFVWNAANGKMRKNTDKKETDRVVAHFTKIVEALETSADILWTVIDLQEGKSIPCSTLGQFDHITASGIISKNANMKEYVYSSTIYEVFLKRLLKGHFRADFCLFHLHQPDMWKRAKTIYSSVLKKKQRNDNYTTFRLRKNHFDNLFNNLLIKLRAAKDVSEFSGILGYVLSIVFDTSDWSIFIVDDSIGKELKFTPDFTIQKHSHDRWLTEEQSRSLEPFMARSILTQRFLTDWTNRWVAVPVFIHENFVRLFISHIKKGRRKWHKKMARFIQDALTVYYYHQTRQDEKKKIDRLISQMESLQLPFGNRPFRRAMGPLWEYLKHLMLGYGIRRFSLYELLADDRIICTTEAYDTWSYKITSMDEWSDIRDIQDKFREIGSAYI